MKNSIEKVIVLWGLLDLLLVASVFFTALQAGGIPYYSKFIEDIAAAKSFGPAYPVAAVFATYLLQVSIILTGFMMLLKIRMGVFLSLAQAPFRLLLIIPPTFFFIASLKSIVPSIYVLLVGVVFILEFYKIYTQIKWLRIKPTSDRSISENAG